ncbi:Mov34/MPN/PAD-1 family protein [Alkalibacillus haloalkaliphilus]|uniref:Mov34/MPN/PAD-1 family protein n=1 Tax=Alkalibacillus haloalkaliphilus TaxID=94136 RepID=A0A511W381_9BACI|nr:M67 family metallopeptidase [Alkalibacillus haloalkaliphilus]GEN45546.1 Mov34/MPN/PAD-1 family protein [Alkalibacillus haloalkaliphilus]
MDKSRLVLPERIVKDMVKLAKTELPNECCGVLSGTNLQVTTFWPLVNEAQSPLYYKVSLNEYLKVKDEISRKGEQLIATFHSHPKTRAIPSYTDRFNHPDQTILMLILSLKVTPPELKGYYIEDVHSYVPYPIVINSQ